MPIDQTERFVSNEDAQRTTRRIGFVLLSIAWAIAYWVWPAGVIDLPMSEFTLGGFLRVIASGGLTLAGIAMLAMLWN